MRDQTNDIFRLEHMLQAINVLLTNKEKYTYEEVMADPIVFFGFVKHVEIIGEAVYMLSKEFRVEHSDIEWDMIEKMRHVLVHGYYHIKPEQLWATVENDIPSLKPIIEQYYVELKGKE